MALTEVPVTLQQDTLSPAPGGGVRSVQALVNISGVMTPVIMQVVGVADANGAVLSDIGDLTTRPFEPLLIQLRAIRQLLAQIAQVPDVDPDPETQRR